MNLPPPTETQARVIWAGLTALAVAALMGLVVAVVWGLGQMLQLLSPVLWPLAVAAVIAYLLDPVVDFLERRRFSRTRAILLVFFLAVVIVAAVLASIVPRLVDETRELVQRVPVYSHTLQKKAQQWIQNPPKPLRDLLRKRGPSATPPVASTNETAIPPGTNAEPVVAATNATVISTNAVAAPSWSENIDQKAIASVTSWLAAVLPKVGTWLLNQLVRVASWFGVLIGLALVPVYAFYFLLEKRGIAEKWTDYLPIRKSALKDELVFVIRSINDYLIAFFRGQVLVATCDGILYTIGFLAIGLNYAFLIGFFAIVLTIIPFIGAFLTCTAALILAFVQYGGWWHPLLVLVVFGIVQFLEGFVIVPKIMGGRVGLHPLTIIIAVVAGTTLLGGLLGGILAIPLTATLRVLMFRYVWKHRPTESAQ